MREKDTYAMVVCVTVPRGQPRGEVMRRVQVALEASPLTRGLAPEAGHPTLVRPGPDGPAVPSVM
jgi:hypothetical protein